uniref:peripheral-type benzodiazepine receptor-associated protein 1-like isoform X2 n=1 Tax=Oncorhynchus gorbuscha TaxID=8017 RepID=UPI001EAF3558|nr:peripheral-type benzodiazepine receptor-associated protein 1-like isoform X2 [Oncorhynchus gorbuscha]
MYDLCTRPEQPPEPEPEQPPEPEPEQPPEPEPEQPVSAANTEDMEGRCHGEAEAPGQQNRIQQDRGTKTEEHGNTTTTTNGDSMDKANLDTTSTTVTTPVTPKRHNSLYKDLNDCEVGGFRKNGTDYGFLMRQNSELLRSLDEMEKTCNHLREENVLLRKSSAPETEEKVKRLRRKNIELAVIARRLEDRAHKLQEANLKMVNAPAPVEQYKRAFARQRARDLAQHADTLLSKDKEIAALQQECREMETRLGTAKGSPVPSGVVEFERLLRESQKEVLRLQRQLSISSSRVISSRVISPKDTSCKDTSCEETSFRVTSPKDISSRVTSAKDTSCKDTSSRLTSSKDTSCKDTSSRVTSSKDASPKDTSSRVTSPKAISSRVTSYKDTSCKDTSSRVTSSKDTSCKDTSSRVTSSKDTSCKDTSSRVTSPKDICSRVTSPKDPSSRVTSPKDPSSRVTFLKDASWKDTSSKDACCRVASCKDTSCKDTSCKDPSGRKHNGHERPCITKEEREEKVAAETQFLALNEAPARCEETPREEEGPRVIPTPPGPAPTPSHSHQKEHTEDQRLQLLECELSKKRKECEDLEHEVRKRQKGCLDLESQLEDERGKNGHLEEEADLLRRKAQLLDQTWVENEELREHLSEVTAQRDSGLKENQRLRVKLDNLEQVLKHMREVAERRQQLELEHEQALAILKFKQNEIKRLQRAEFFAKREHEGVVQMLESKVRELEDKCHSQREQFSLLSHELETFRLQAGKLDLSGSTILTNPPLCHLTNGVGLTGDVATTLRMGANPHAAGLTRSPTVKHRELPTISLTKSSSTPKSASDTTHLSPKSAESHHSPHHSPRRTSPTPHEVDTASEVEELDIDVSPAPYTALRGASQLQVFIARYSYNPYDGPNDNPEVELPLTAGEYIYVYGGMDDDGFYEGELMDGRRGLVPSNFVERVSDDDMISAHVPEGTDISHNSLLDSSLHSASHQHHLCLGGPGTSERTDPTSAASVPVSLSVPSGEQFPSDPSLPAPLTNGLDLDLEVGVGTVPYPRKLTLIKQLAKSIIISWDGPLVPAGWGNVWSYNVYVDQELKLNVPFGSQTKAVLERLDVTLKAYRVSVQSLTERGNSDQLRCSLLVGRDVCVAPTQLRVDRVTATSASLAWLPSNSNYVHVVSLNEEEMELVKAGSYSLCLGNLTPSLQYTVKVEAQPHQTPWEIPQERREHKTATTTFTTLAAGPPDAPLGVQLEQGPSPGIALISWLPVTIDAAGTSNGVRVTGYTIYADKRKVLEVSSPTAGSALMGPSQIQSLMAAHELTVRTMSAHGESIDSVPVNVPVKLSNIMTGQASAASCSSSTPICQSTPVHQSPPYQSTPIRQSTPIYQSPPYQSPPVHQSTPVHQSPSYQSPLMHQSTPVHQSPSYQSPLMHQSTPVHQSPSYQSPLMHQSTPVHQSPSYQSPLMHQSTPVHQSPSYQSPPVHQSTPVHQSPSYQSPPVHQSTPVHQSPPYQSPLMHQSTPVHQSAPYQSPPVHQSTPVHQSPPYLSSSPPFQPQSPSYGNSAAKVSTLPYATASPPLDVAHAMGPNGALHTEACSPHPASYAEVWANPLAKSPVPPWAALAVLEAMSSPVALNYQAKLPSVPSAYQAMLPSVPSAYQAMLPSVPSAYQAMLPSVPSAYQAMLPSASHINTTSPHLGPAAATEQSRADTDRPRVLRPVMSITDFLPVEDDSRVNLSTPEPYPTPPKALVPPAGDLINPLDTQPLRPPRAPSPLESEPDYSMERPTTRLVSMEEFLSQDQDTGFNRQQRYTAGPMEPESSRGSDLSDILEEEEDDLYSDPPGSALARGYTTGANRPDQWEVPDSDEEIVEKILKLPPQAQTQAYHYHQQGHHHHNEHLFSIPEVTDDEDNSVDYTHRRHRRQSQAGPSHHPDDPHYHSPRHQPQPHHHHHHHSSRPEANEPSPRHSGGAVFRAQNRVHYTDTEDSISHPEEGLLDTGGSRDVWVPRATKKAHHGGGGSKAGTMALVGGLGDRLRREALLRSQMAVAAFTTQATGHTPGLGSHPVSKNVRKVNSPVGSVTEIDLEYGTDEEEPLTYDPGERGEVVLDQMSSEWWVEGVQPEPRPRLRGKPALQAIIATAAEWESGRDLSMEAGAGWSGQPGLSPKLTRSEVIHQLKESMDHSWPIGDNEVRIFVALFPYDPVNMSPNPDAAEEELPFREGQIIKIYGDKDSDGFYRGESSGRHGYVPCNMVSEIQVEDEETRETLLQQGFLSTATNMEKIGTRSHAQLPRRPVPPPKPRRSRKVEAAALWEDSLDSSSQGPSQSDVATANPADTGPRRMKAIFDYDPRESSPNADIEVELTFGAGDIIYVFGDMDDDGFFYGDLNGHKGLVPSNFLQAAPEAAGKAPPFDSQPPSVAEPRTESQVSLSTFPEEVPHPPIHTGLTGPVHTHPPLHTGLTGPAHTHPPLHTELTGPVHTHPPLHTELTGPVHTHPPLHTELTGPVHTHPPLHTELTGPVHTHPPLHIELTGPVHTHPPLHIELTGPVHTHPPLHTELTGPVHTHPPLHIELTGPVHTDHQHLDPSAAAAMMKPSSMDPAPTPSLSTSPPHVPAESPPQTDVSPPGKKKKGLFSKGKKLFKKLGSSKKD